MCHPLAETKTMIFFPFFLTHLKRVMFVLIYVLFFFQSKRRRTGTNRTRDRAPTSRLFRMAAKCSSRSSVAGRSRGEFLASLPGEETSTRGQSLTTLKEVPYQLGYTRMSVYNIYLVLCRRIVIQQILSHDSYLSFFFINSKIYI